MQAIVTPPDQSPDARRIAILPVSWEVLRGALRLPHDVRLLGASMEHYHDVVLLKIEGDGLPLARPGEPLLRVEPRYTTHHDTRETVAFDGWY